MTRFSQLAQRVLVSVAIAASLCLLVQQFSRTALVRDFENWGYDLLVNFEPRGPQSGKVIIVDFDDATVEALHSFPVPRTVVADLIARAAAGKPDLIGLDMIVADR